MLVLFIFTAIMACITMRLLIYFFKAGTTIFQLITITLLLALTLSLVGYMTGSVNIPFLDSFIIR